MLLDALDDEAFDLFKETELAASIAAVVVAVFSACASNLPTVRFHRESGRRGKNKGPSPPLPEYPDKPLE